jgi:hypothetical protein
MSEIERFDKISLRDQMRLVEIAHETRDDEIKQAALRILELVWSPSVQQMPVEIKFERGMAYPLSEVLRSME